MYYVSISHVTESQLEFLGYNMVKENEEFRVYNHVYTGEDQIVRESDPRMYVEDLNDALAIRSAKGWIVPDDV